MLDEVEERRLAPVDVVEDDDERPLRGRVLEQLAERPGDLLGELGLPVAEERGERSRRRPSLGRVELLHDLRRPASS